MSVSIVANRVALCLLVGLACLWTAPAGARGASIESTKLTTGKVTYLDLAPQVELSLQVQAERGRLGRVCLEYTIVELTKQKELARGVEKVRLGRGQNEFRTVLPLRVDRMTGLLARARVLESEGGQELARAECPFDVTGDLRTNFRYAGETYGHVEKALEPKLIGEGKTMDDFWSVIQLGTTPQEQLDALAGCFMNAAQVSVEEGRGHFTCWEDGRTTWTKTAYYAQDIWEFSLDRIKSLYDKGEQRGMYMLPWTDGKGTRQEYFDENFPWIYHPNKLGYYPGCWLMNLDPSYKHKLTPEELKMAKFDLHGTDSWLDYIVEELYRVSEFYGTRVIWWDNSHGDTHIEYTLSRLREKWCQAHPDVMPPLLMINGDAGYESDIYWIEHNLPPKMEPYVSLMRWHADVRPAVKSGGATISSGQDHPRVGSGQQEAITSPANLYNDPAYAFMYRQLLFECIAADPRLVFQQQWPRNNLEWRILHFPQAFKEHARTWGFMTQFEHVYNSRDVIQYPLWDKTQVCGTSATLETSIQDGALHVVARSLLSDPDTVYLHLFNYLGTTTDIHVKRSHPQKQDKVTVRMQTPGFAQEYRVRIFSPDFERYGDFIEPAVRTEANWLEFDAPVDTYNLAVVNKRWAQ